ncbi:MAG: outer membrane beta-barrel protein [Desulfobacterota bacterium]|nr:outer membrane beta-barrel protein [Thermodesulfobacteriota bacterium]
MKRLARYVLSIAFIVFNVLPVSAAGIDLTNKTSLGIMGSYQNWSSDGGDDTDFDVFSGGLNLSYFLTNNWEFGFNGTVHYTSDDSSRRYSSWKGLKRYEKKDEDDDRGAISLEGICNYNISTGESWMPYLGAALGGVYYSNRDDEEWGTSFGGQAGVKFFATDSVFFNIEYRYRRWFVDAENDGHYKSRSLFGRSYHDGDDDDDDLDSHGVFVGVSWVF